MGRLTHIWLTALILASGERCFADAHEPVTRSHVVVCVSESSGPWTVIGMGTLTKSQDGPRTDYHLEVGEHHFYWYIAHLSDRTIEITGPVVLMETLAPELAARAGRGPGAIDKWHHEVPVTGEIRERIGTVSLAVRLGSSC
jgi:hypothetical protein